mmetsp:Transcript_27312/g.45547  ORF Transcript_27312/g.45547 Transcript_27312/m.45547 type:complete len:324 (+) Transcript_27312:2-973(+)
MCGYTKCSTALRMKLQWARLQRQTMLLMENKIFAQDYLKALNLPTIKPIYAALRRATGEWPSFSETQVNASLLGLDPVRQTHSYVLKAATDGGGNNVYPFNSSVWVSQGWTTQRLIETARSIVAQPGLRTIKENSRGQFEQTGVLLVPRYDIDPELPAETMLGVAELKFTTVFGVPLVARVVKVCSEKQHGRTIPTLAKLERENPAAGTLWKCMKVSLETCTQVLALVNDNRHLIDRWAMRVALFFGADWFRLDIMTGNPLLGWRVNEITYPGGIPSVHSGTAAAWKVLLQQYQTQAQTGGVFRRVAESFVLKRIADSTRSAM